MQTGHSLTWLQSLEKAMDKQTDSMKQNQVYEWVDLPSGAKAIPQRWVFVRKDLADGSVKHKARTVAKGFMQEHEGEPAFAPTLKFSTVRWISALASSAGWSVRQLDVVTAFLQAEIPEKERVYVQPPQGYARSDGKVWRLKKALYGLRSSPRYWNFELHSWLVSQGYERSVADPCLYRQGGLFLVVYADDILRTGPDALGEKAPKCLPQRFQITDLGAVHLCQRH